MHRKHQRSKTKFVVLALLFLFIGSGFLFHSYYSQSNRVASGLPTEYGTKKMSDKAMKKYVNEKVNANQVTLEVYPEVDVKAGGINGNMWIHNVPVNKVGQQATLLDENNKEISKTGLIKPGYQVDIVKLNRKLDKGLHKGTIKITFYDLQKEEKIGQESVEAQIKVE